MRTVDVTYQLVEKVWPEAAEKTPDNIRKVLGYIRDLCFEKRLTEERAKQRVLDISSVLGFVPQAERRDAAVEQPEMDALLLMRETAGVSQRVKRQDSYSDSRAAVTGGYRNIRRAYGDNE